MKKSNAALLTALLALGFWGCSSHDQEKAKTEISDDANKTADAAKKAGAEIKDGAKDVANKVDAAVKPDGEKASDKASAGVDKMKDAASSAGTKLDQAGLLAKVKTQIASNAGLATLTGINVDVSGSEVTLLGSVATAEQKKTAEQVASQVVGVTRVHNKLSVKP